MPSIEEIEKHGKLRRGKKEWIRHQKGERLTRNEAIKGFCYECNGYGELCDCDIRSCCLYPYSPYAPPGDRVKIRKMTDEHLAALMRGRTES